MRTSACILLAAATLAAGPAAAPAAAQAAPAIRNVATPDAPEPSSPVRLELRFKAGQSYRFRVTEDSTLSTALPSGGTRRSTTRLDCAFELTVDRANPDGSYFVRARPIRQSLTVNDRDIVPTEANKAEATATLSRDGRVSGIAGVAKKEGSNEQVMDARDFLETIFDEEAGYPGRALAVGEGWKDEVESPLDEKGSRITINNTLMSLDVLDGKPVARLLNVVAQPMQVPADENGVGISGTIEGGGLTTVDLATGLPVDGRDTIRMKMTISAPKPDSTEKVNIESEAAIKIRVQALPPDAV